MAIKLRSCEGEIFEVPEAVARHSQVLFRLIEDMDPKAPIHVAPGIDIPVPIVTSKVLAKVLDYCKKHAEAADAATTEMDNWDSKFVNSVDLLMLQDLFIAADYLEIDGLLNLVYQKVVDMIKEKNLKHFSKIENTQNEFTAEEVWELLRYNQLAMITGEICCNTGFY